MSPRTRSLSFNVGHQVLLLSVIGLGAYTDLQSTLVFCRERWAHVGVPLWPLGIMFEAAKIYLATAAVRYLLGGTWKSRAAGCFYAFVALVLMRFTVLAQFDNLMRNEAIAQHQQAEVAKTEALSSHAYQAAKEREETLKRQVQRLEELSARLAQLDRLTAQKSIESEITEKQRDLDKLTASIANLGASTVSAAVDPENPNTVTLNTFFAGNGLADFSLSVSIMVQLVIVALSTRLHLLPKLRDDSMLSTIEGMEAADAHRCEPNVPAVALTAAMDQKNHCEQLPGADYQSRVTTNDNLMPQPTLPTDVEGLDAFPDKRRRRVLSPEQALELRGRIAAGETKKSVATALGISRETVYQYLRN